MKSILNSLFATATALVALVACEKQENRVVLPETTTSTITATPSSLSVAPDRTNLTGTALTMKWTPATYGVNVPVRYVVQFDKLTCRLPTRPS